MGLVGKGGLCFHMPRGGEQDTSDLQCKLVDSSPSQDTSVYELVGVLDRKPESRQSNNQREKDARERERAWPERYLPLSVFQAHPY